MEKICEIKNLCKSYPGFKLENLGFCLEEGSITGFVGRNGAGKSTAIKSMLNLVHPDGGEISFFGLDMSKKERQIKQRIGYSSSGVHYYERKRIRDIAAVTSRFYEHWDSRLFDEYIKKFGIDDLKKPVELSEGMKVKFSLAMALSHGARLLILDEPTSGLDPVSREQLLELFMGLSQKGITLLFSTHIISDIEKCAHKILYIQKGKLLFGGGVDDFKAGYKIARVARNGADRPGVLGKCLTRNGATVLIKADNGKDFENVSDAGLEDIMVHLEKEEEN